MRVGRALDRGFDVALVAFLVAGWLAAAVVLFLAAPWWAGVVELAVGVPLLTALYSTRDDNL